jgi:ATP-dependent DNA helicase RecG
MKTVARLKASSIDVQAMLEQGMGPTLHWFPSDVPPSRLASVLAGMANTQGGTVLLGVAPRSAQILGLSDPDACLDQVFQAALLLDPPLVLPVPRLSSVPAAGSHPSQALVISIPAGLPNVYSLDGRYLGRDGSQTNPLSARRLRHLLMERGVIQFESQVPPGATLDDLDPQKIAAYLDALGLPGEDAPEVILLGRGCLQASGARPSADSARVRTDIDSGVAPPVNVDRATLRPTYAALLMFGKQPQRWLPNATILAARFSGRTLTDHFIKHEIRGVLTDQLHQAEAFIRDHLSSEVRLVGLTHQEIPTFPLEALRELLVNAVAHRDYNIQGDNIHIYMFADRIEIHSPGGLPGPMTLDNLLEARFSRNPVMMQCLADLGFVERLGYGLNRVVETMVHSGLRQPRFEEAAGMFRVTLQGAGESQPGSAPLSELKAYQTLELNPRQEQALAFLLSRRRITSRDYQELCPDVHAETLRRDLVDLVERSLLIKVGDKRATYYILKR